MLIHAQYFIRGDVFAVSGQSKQVSDGLAEFRLIHLSVKDSEQKCFWSSYYFSIFVSLLSLFDLFLP